LETAEIVMPLQKSDSKNQKLRFDIKRSDRNVNISRASPLFPLEQKARINGSGFFFSALIDELKRRKVDLTVEGIDLLSKPQKEVERIADLLGMKV
jgi:hypothetical protein